MKKIIKIIGILILVSVAGLFLYLFTVVPGKLMVSMNETVFPGPYTVSEEAAKLHNSLFVADLHCDATLWNRDLLDRDTRGHVDVPRLLEGNVALQGFTAATRTPYGQNSVATEDKLDQMIPLTFISGWPASTWLSSHERALYQAQRLHDAARRSEGVLTVIETKEDLAEYVEKRKTNPKITAGFLGVEGLHALEGDLENVRVLYNAGYRMMAPTHFFDNLVGGSMHGMKKYGLTEFGKVVIEFMQELHIIVDLAHCSSKVVDDVLAMATGPVVTSHTGVKGTCDNNRNLSDEQLQGIAATGGLIGIGFFDFAVCGEDVDHIVAAIKYTADLVGVDYVALGSDFDGAVVVPIDTTGVAMITEGLMEVGFSDEDIAKIMGANVQRVLALSLPSRDFSSAAAKKPSVE